MPSPVLFLLISTLLPLTGFFLLLTLGKKLGNPLAGWIGSAFSIGSFGCTLAAMVYWYSGAHGVEHWGFAIRPIFRAIAWLSANGPTQGNSLELGVYIDSLTIAMFAMVTLVAAIVHIFSIGFLRRDDELYRLFAWIGLADFSMLGMVLSGTLLQLLAFWMLIGFSTFLLVGGNFDQLASSRAALRSFVINRIGDCAVLIGLCLLYFKVGNSSFPSLWAMLGDASAGHAVILAGGSWLATSYTTLAGLILFCGAIARGSQFPLQLWLPGASNAPLPGVAMICSVTTAAGVYLVGRLFPILTPDARLFIAIIGLTTLTMGALIALVQRDLVRLLTWVTVGQLGYMMLAMGVGSWVGGLFHLITHAFIIATLFLAAGSVIAANLGERDMLKLLAGWKQLPVTAGAFAVAVLAMAGAPFLSKYYSQSMVVTDAAAFATFATGAAGRAWGYWLFFALPTAMTCVTAFTMARCWMLVFHDKPPASSTQSRLREHPALWAPLLAMMIPAIIAGYSMNVPELLVRSMIEATAMCDDLRSHNPNADHNHVPTFDQAWPAAEPSAVTTDADETIDSPSVSSRAAEAFEHGRMLQRRWLSWAWLVGIGLAVSLYWRGDALAAHFVRRWPVKWVHAWLENEMYFAELYEWTVVKLASGLATACAAFDHYILDGVFRAGVSIIRRLRLRER